MSVRSLMNRFLMTRPRVHPWLAAPFLMIFGGCNLFAETVTPLPVEVFGDPDSADHVIVLLPGIRDRGSDFVDEGFVEDARGLIDDGRLALIVADAHVGYYRERSVTERLKADILDTWPQRKLTLAGISLGGFGALTVARRFPQRIESLFLMAPFLGEDSFLKRVESGLPEPRPDDRELQQELVPIWRFLAESASVPVTLAYGHDDGFAPLYRALQPLGSKARMRDIDGGHDWETWRQLWRQYLQDRFERPPS